MLKSVFLAVLVLQVPAFAAEEPAVDDPTGIDASSAAETFGIPAIRVDFPVKAGMTVEQIDEFVEAQDSLAREIDPEKEYLFGVHKRDIESGNGWMHYWVNGKRLLHCDIVVRGGKAQSVWVMPGNDKWTAMVYFRLSGIGTHEVGRIVDPSTIETDNQLAELDRPLRLDRLWLHGPKFTDRGMAELRRFENVEIVSFNFPAVSGESLQQLQVLKKLRKLDLGSVKCTNNDLRHIASITSLQKLSLRGNKAISDGALTHLTRLPLRSLDLSGTSVTSDGVKQLLGIRELTELSLSECHSVDDRAIDALSSMNQLRGLSVLFSAISKDGADVLRHNLPKCRIIFADVPNRSN